MNATTKRQAISTLRPGELVAISLRGPQLEAISALAPFAENRAYDIRLATLPPATDRRRCLGKARSRYRRLLDHALLGFEWLCGLDLDGAGR